MLIDNFLSAQEFSPEKAIKKDIWLSNNFTAALICLEEGVEIEPHTEPFAVFFLVLEGRGVFTNSEGSFELGPMGSMTIGPGETRGIRCLERLSVLGVHDPHGK